MVFNSLQFLVFFLVITLWFFRLRHQRQRQWLLLIGSCYFYMSFVPRYILILGATIVIDYIAGLQIARRQGAARRAWLIASITANVGILAYFKYCNFFLENLNMVLDSLHAGKQLSLLSIVLPVGLSFHTFQAMSYTIEVYRENQEPEHNFLTYALYVMYYPQLVAGPIERPQNVLPQLHGYKPYDWEDVKEGLARMMWGFFKKVVIADRLAMLVDHCFAEYGHLSWYTLLLAAVMYAFQIYCDFSGYSDIALGAARVMGVKLMTNFNQPLLSRNISEFWRRWHISLSTWFNDYVFLPIATALRNWGTASIYTGLFITFFLSGFWHGAGWNYILFASLHGFVIMLETRFKKQRKRLFNALPQRAGNVLAHFLTFSFIVLAWVFFRATSMPHAWAFLSGIFTLQGGDFDPGLHINELLFALLAAGFVLVREYRMQGFAISRNRRFAWYMAVMVVVCYFFGVFGENQFIYFQF